MELYFSVILSGPDLGHLKQSKKKKKTNMLPNSTPSWGMKQQSLGTT